VDLLSFAYAEVLADSPANGTKMRVRILGEKRRKIAYPACPQATKNSYVEDDTQTAP